MNVYVALHSQCLSMGLRLVNFLVREGFDREICYLPFSLSLLLNFMEVASRQLLR